MANWPELKAIVLPFPCLWDPQDPYFLDKTVKAVCREQVLEICNQRSGVHIDMKSLKQWIADNLKQFTPALQTATEEHPITTLPQGPSKVAGCMPQEITATEEHPITTLPQGPSKVAGCMPQEITATDKLPVTTSPQKSQSVRRKVGGYKAGRVLTLEDLIKEFPCLWDTKDLNHNDNIMRRRCMELLLQKFNRHASTQITMVDLRRKVNTLLKRLYRVAIGKSKSASAISLLNHGKRNQKTVAPQRMPKLQDLLKPFPCLWDTTDLNYNDYTMRRRCMELLLQKFNRLSSTEITMADLRRKLATLHKSLYRVATGKSKSASATSLLNHEKRNQKTVAPQGMPKLQDLLKPFPCLWDTTDLNYNDYTMRRRCMELLLQKFNRLSSTEITMADLRRKLATLHKSLYRVATGKSKSASATSLLNHEKRNQKTVAPQGMPKLQDLLKPFPCLWDTTDLNYNDNTMRRRCIELLLQKFNRLSSTEITMADLRRKLTALHTRLHRVATGKSKSASAASLLNHGKRNQKTVAPQRMPKLQDLLKPFPCLWDTTDLNYNDYTMRRRCMELLLQKFNRLSSTEITMADLRRKLSTLHKRLHRVEARKQRKVPEISEEHLETAGGEKEAQETTVDNFRALFENSQTDQEANIDSTDSNQRPQDAPNQEALVLQGRCIEFNYCRFCGELKICSSDSNDNKPYVANNKCTLIINDLRAELEFTDDVLPRSICKDCERKFQEMVDFVKCVKDAQVKLNQFNNETLDRRRNEDSLAENDTESEKEANGQRKRCKVTVAINSDALQSLSDNNDENNDIQMNNDDETGSFLIIVAESEQRNGSGVSINESAPSLSLNNKNNGNTNSIMSHCHRAETATTYITTCADFLKNIPLNDHTYVNTRQLSQTTHHKSAKDFEDDFNSIDIKTEDETADKDIND